MCFAGVNGTANHEGLNGKVDKNTRSKLQQIISDHENDSNFEYYNSGSESEGSSYSQEFHGTGDIGVVSPGQGWSKDIGNKNFGISSKNIAQSNLQKHKSLSTPLFDLTKLDAVEADLDIDDGNTYALQNDAYDTDTYEAEEPGGLPVYYFFFKESLLYLSNNLLSQLV